MDWRSVLIGTGVVAAILTIAAITFWGCTPLEPVPNGAALCRGHNGFTGETVWRDSEVLGFEAKYARRYAICNDGTRVRA